MTALRRLVLDVLKPHEPTLLEFGDDLAEVDGVAAVTTSLIELDQEVQNVKVTLEGEDLPYAAIEEEIRRLSGTVHSVDQAAHGEYAPEDRRIPQDG